MHASGRAFVCAIVATLVTSTPALCGAGDEWPDGPHKEWFQSLRRPDNDQHPERQLDGKSLFCCGAADVVKTRFKVESAGGEHPEDTWYAWLDDDGPGSPRRRSFKTTRRTGSRTFSCWRVPSSASCGPRAVSERGPASRPEYRSTALEGPPRSQRQRAIAHCDTIAEDYHRTSCEPVYDGSHGSMSCPRTGWHVSIANVVQVIFGNSGNCVSSPDLDIEHAGAVGKWRWHRQHHWRYQEGWHQGSLQSHSRLALPARAPTEAAS
jgi:hypothetical protein